MNREQIMETIRTLAMSQGLYGRILRSLEEAKNNAPENYEKVMEILEFMQFKDAVDLVMFFEGA